MKSRFKNIPDILTLLRLFLTFILIYFLVKKYSSYYILLLFTLIFISDMLDGYAARKLNAESKAGGIFDSVCDFVYIVFLLVFFNLQNKIPVWFTFVVIINFLWFVITSKIIMQNNKNKHAFAFDYIGRFTAVLIYIIPLIAFKFGFVLYAAVYISSFLSAVTFLYRFYFALNKLKNKGDVKLWERKYL